MLLKLYLYGYMNRIRSSRRLERETKINIELMWLLEDFKSSHTTIEKLQKLQERQARCEQRFI
jgi:transposase